MDFVANTEKDQKEMLSKIGVNSLEELFSDIPESLKNISLNLPQGLSEQTLAKYFEKIGKKTLLLNARHINHQNLVLIAFEEIKNRKSNE